jgi:hypothetical protein
LSNNELDIGIELVLKELVTHAKGKAYLWDDKVSVGEVTTWVRRGYTPPEDIQLNHDWDMLACEHDYYEEY